MLLMCLISISGYTSCCDWWSEGVITLEPGCVANVFDFYFRVHIMVTRECRSYKLGAYLCS